MIKCSACNKELEDGAKFCSGCGTSIVIEESDKSEIDKFTEIPHKKSPKKAIAISIVVIALILALSILVISFFSEQTDSAYALYIKDSEMYMTDMLKSQPLQITDNLADDYEKSELEYLIGYSTRPYITADGKMIFYTDNISEEGNTLYYRYFNSEKEPVKIDSDVSKFEVGKSGRYIIYLDYSGSLYQYDLENKNKIANDVVSFYVSKSGEKVMYLTEEKNLYIAIRGKDGNVKIDSDVASIRDYDEEYSTVYYMKNTDLYKKTEGKDKEKIASDVSYTISIYDSGEIYYIKSKNVEKTYADYVEDDMEEIDSAMVKPERPELPSYSDYSMYSDFYEAYKLAYEEYKIKLDEYYDAQEKYREKEARDTLREQLKSKTLSDYQYTLCYFDGKNENILEEKFYNYYYACAEKRPVLVYTTRVYKEFEKPKLSEIESYSEVEELIFEYRNEPDSETYISINGNSVAIEYDDAQFFHIDEHTDNLYFLADMDKDDLQCGDLYKMDISGNTPEDATLYDKNVYSHRLISTEDGNLIYYKDYINDYDNDNFGGELYMNKERIASDVYNCYYIEDSKTIVYTSDYDDGLTALRIYDGGKSIKVADNIKDFEIMQNNEILYLSDYNNEKYRGTLNLYKNAKSVKLDEDVVCIVSYRRITD